MSNQAGIITPATLLAIPALSGESGPFGACSDSRDAEKCALRRAESVATMRPSELLALEGFTTGSNPCEQIREQVEQTKGGRRYEWASREPAIAASFSR